MLQTTPCGYSKLVSWEAWYNAKGFSPIRASCPEKTSKKWSDIALLSVKLNISISRHILGVFSAQDARIKLIPFALYQASQDTSLEYPHEVVWNILKINFFKDWSPWGTLRTHFWEKIKMFQWSLFYTTAEKSLDVKGSKDIVVRFIKLTQ